MKTQLLVTLAILGAFQTSGCSKPAEAADDKESSSSSKKKSDEDSDEAPKPKRNAKADKAKAKPAEVVEMVETDLSSRGAEWKGWSIKAPANAKVMEDFANARVAGKGCPITDKCPQFDLILSQKKPDLKARKKTAEQAAEFVDSKATFTKETADELEWNDGKGLANFVHVIKVAGKDITCSPLRGSRSETDLATMKDACKTLAKK